MQSPYTLRKPANGLRPLSWGVCVGIVHDELRLVHVRDVVHQRRVWFDVRPDKVRQSTNDALNWELPAGLGRPNRSQVRGCLQQGDHRQTTQFEPLWLPGVDVLVEVGAEVLYVPLDFRVALQARLFEGARESSLTARGSNYPDGDSRLAEWVSALLARS